MVEIAARRHRSGRCGHRWHQRGGTVWAAITQRIVINPLTGLAISDFDPVAYFTDHKPRLGHASLEYSYGGTIWRFCNIGNRDAFVRYPHVYMPEFGGYDPGALAHGVALPGNTLIWLVAGERLYLFNSASARTTFAADPASAVTAAERGWQQVKPTLVPWRFRLQANRALPGSPQAMNPGTRKLRSAWP